MPRRGRPPRWLAGGESHQHQRHAGTTKYGAARKISAWPRRDQVLLEEELHRVGDSTGGSRRRHAIGPMRLCMRAASAARTREDAAGDGGEGEHDDAATKKASGRSLRADPGGGIVASFSAMKASKSGLWTIGMTKTSKLAAAPGWRARRRATRDDELLRACFGKAKENWVMSSDPSRGPRRRGRR